MIALNDTGPYGTGKSLVVSSLAVYRVYTDHWDWWITLDHLCLRCERSLFFWLFALLWYYSLRASAPRHLPGSVREAIVSSSAVPALLSI